LQTAARELLMAAKRGGIVMLAWIATASGVAG
jgi:hypothetical protein